MQKVKTKKHPESEGLSSHHRLLILVLLIVILLAVIGHFILRPDRNAALKIIYTGDMQGQTTYISGRYAGYERIAALAEEASQEGSYVLLLDAGNCLGGSESAEIDEGSSMITLMNAVGYDAMVPGPMDFIYGSGTLSSLTAEAEFPFLAANIKKTDGSHAFENYKILNIDGVRIGVIGVTAGLNQIQADRDSLTAGNPVEAVQAVMTQLREKTDAVIVLAYTGDESVTDAIAALEGVSMVIESGGAEASVRTLEDGTVIACPGKKGSVIGVASLQIDRDGAVIENEFCKPAIYDSLVSNEQVLNALDTVSRNKSAAEAEQLGYLELNTETEANVVIGNLTADAMLDAASGDGASAAWIRDRSILGTLAAGDIRRGEVDALFDDDLYMVICKMTGGEMRSALEASFENYPDAEGLLQISGMSCTYNASTDIGSHLSDIMIGGHMIDDARTYKVAMTNTLADELGYTSEASGRINHYQTLATILSQYIQKQYAADTQNPVMGAEKTETDAAADDETVSETKTSERIHMVE